MTLILTGISVYNFHHWHVIAWVKVDLLQPWLQVYVSISYFIYDKEEVFTDLFPFALDKLQNFTHLKKKRYRYTQIILQLNHLCGIFGASFPTWAVLVVVLCTISTSSSQKKPQASRLSRIHWMLLTLDTSISLWHVSRYKHLTFLAWSMLTAEESQLRNRTEVLIINYELIFTMSTKSNHTCSLYWGRKSDQWKPTHEWENKLYTLWLSVTISDLPVSWKARIIIYFCNIWHSQKTNKKKNKQTLNCHKILMVIFPDSVPMLKLVQ